MKIFTILFVLSFLCVEAYGQETTVSDSLQECVVEIATDQLYHAYRMNNALVAEKIAYKEFDMKKIGEFIQAHPLVMLHGFCSDVDSLTNSPMVLEYFKVHCEGYQLVLQLKDRYPDLFVRDGKLGKLVMNYYNENNLLYQIQQLPLMDPENVMEQREINKMKNEERKE